MNWKYPAAAAIIVAGVGLYSVVLLPRPTPAPEVRRTVTRPPLEDSGLTPQERIDGAFLCLVLFHRGFPCEPKEVAGAHR